MISYNDACVTCDIVDLPLILDCSGFLQVGDNWKKSVTSGKTKKIDRKLGKMKIPNKLYK